MLRSWLIHMKDTMGILSWGWEHRLTQSILFPLWQNMVFTCSWMSPLKKLLWNQNLEKYRALKLLTLCLWSFVDTSPSLWAEPVRSILRFCLSWYTMSLSSLYWLGFSAVPMWLQTRLVSELPGEQKEWVSIYFSLIYRHLKYIHTS